MVVLFLGEKRCLVSGKEDRGSCLEVLGERTKRKGVWLVISLDVKELEWPVGIVFVWKEEPSVYFWVPDKGLLRRRC